MLTLAIATAGIGTALAAGDAWSSGAPTTADRQAVRVDPPPRSLAVVAVGDWLSEGRVNRAAEAFASPGVRLDHLPLLAPVAPMIAAADLALCHMETPISWPDEAYGFVGRAATGTSLIAAPWELAGDLRRVGFDRCSTASNHSWDLGAGGIESTLAALESVGISHDGTARSAGEAGVDVFTVGSVRVAHVSLALNSNTGFPRESWRIRRAVDAGSVRALVDAARAGGAEIVIVSLHVFKEISSVPAPADRALVSAFTAAGGVDLVVIHGPHTIQPLEWVNATPVFWSVGNFVSGMGVPGRDRFSDLRTLDGLAATVRFTERPEGGFTAEPAAVLLCQMVDTRVVYPALATPPNPAIEACIARSTPVLSFA
jgi:poly-gamma-glutamate synthesis protein (capsule biosynthesis protein)